MKTRSLKSRSKMSFNKMQHLIANLSTRPKVNLSKLTLLSYRIKPRRNQILMITSFN